MEKVYLCQITPTKKGRSYLLSIKGHIPESKVHGANMGPIWGRQDPGGPHIGPMNLAISDSHDYEIGQNNVLPTIIASKTKPLTTKRHIPSIIKIIARASWLFINHSVT